MEPLTLASAYATIVGLICNFRREKGTAEALDHRQFVEWLAKHNHEELKKLIVGNAALQSGVDKLLGQ